MALFAIADLHFAFSVDKPMDIFGENWKNHSEKIIASWKEHITEEDTVLLPGDLSWGMRIDEAAADLDVIYSLPGRKILLGGNHDYWWKSSSKLEARYPGMRFLKNNFDRYADWHICGTRGWIKDTEEPADAKVLTREAGRLETSIKAALADGKKPIVFLHYPPIFANDYNREILDVLFRYDIKTCYYGHLHGNAHRYAVCGEVDGINYQLIAGDFVQFCPKLIM